MFTKSAASIKYLKERVKLASYNNLSNRNLPVSKYFQVSSQLRNDFNNFCDIYNDYGLYAFVKKGLTSKEELKKIHEERPLCIEALLKLEVIAAVEEKKFTIRDLSKLDDIRLNKILGLSPDADVRKDSDAIAKIVKSYVATAPAA